jgi:hypothetical protein
MTEVEIKAAVRERDGHRCRDCCMTEQDHIHRTGQRLEVHRVIPGIVYDEENCVTLCRRCHGKKPKTIKNAYFMSPEKSGVYLYSLNLYNAVAGQLYATLEAHAETQQITVDEMVDQILLLFCEENTLLNYVI